MLDSCPTPDELAAFQHGRLALATIDRIGDHLDDCSWCESLLDSVDDSGDTVVSGLRAAAARDRADIADLLAEPAFHEFDAYARQLVRNTVDATQWWASPAAKETAGSELPKPEKIGRFLVVDQLGKGGFANVYRARDPDHDRLVAVKVPRLDNSKSEASIEGMLSEARTVAVLDHPAIVTVHEWGRCEDGNCFVAMQLIDGSSLQDAMKSTPFDLREAVELVTKVALALHYAHKQGLVHRDIKPANILLDRQGEPHVADFGLALHDDQQWSRRGELAGTRPYMAPEQVRSEAHRLDGRTDIWSLAVILYELLTGRRPFAGANAVQLFDEIQHREPKPPRQLNDGIPIEVERICLKCLSKKMTDRYSTALDLANELQGFMDRPATRPSSTVAKSTSVVPKGVRAFGAEDKDFFLDLLPGPRDANGLPDSIRSWKTRLEDMNPAAAPVCVLYGPSGCGKSSFVRAGLLPRLAPTVLPIYVEATDGSTEDQLLVALRRQCPDLSDESTLSTAVAALRSGKQLPPGCEKVLIVLDQFEQWLHANREDIEAPLIQALRQCDGAHVQCLILVRDDFWMSVTRFMRELEVTIVEGSNSAAVDLFDERHAGKVLTLFGRAFGALPNAPAALQANQENFIAQAVAGLAEDGKLACVHLALFAEMVKSKPWQPQTVKDLGGISGVGVRYLDETFVAKTAPPGYRMHQQAVRSVLRALLPARGTNIKGRQQSQDTLLAASGLGRHSARFEDVLRILDRETRLVTPVEPGCPEDDKDSPPAQRHFQLTHDFLVPSVREWLTRAQKATMRGRAELRLAERAELWQAKQERRQLPSLWEFVAFATLTTSRHRTDTQREFMRSATKYHAISIPVGAAFASLMLWCAIAAYQYTRVEMLVGRLLESKIEEVPPIAEQLRSRWWSKSQLNQALQQNINDPQKHLVISIALLPMDLRQQEYLHRQLLGIPPNEFVVTIDALQRYGKQPPLREFLQSEFQTLAAQRKRVPPESEDAAGLLAEKQARAMLGLVHIGQTDRVIPHLKHSPRPTLRTYLIHGMATHGVDPHVVIDKMLDESEPNSKAALLFALKLYPLDDLPVERMTSLTRAVEQIYRDHPNSEVHSAAECLLRSWQREDLLGRARLDLQSREPVEGKDWYVNSQGITLAKIKGPVQFQMGNAANRKPRYVDAPAHQRRINWSFALATTMITVRQAQRSGLEIQSQKQMSPQPECPINSITQQAAMAYCNWLSEQEGIMPDQWCYIQITGGETTQLRVADDFFARTGYRLPSEGEWEFSCKTNTITPLPFGNARKLFSHYAWLRETSQRQAWPPGMLLPNDLGLFDMHGNLAQWCQDSYYAYPDGSEIHDETIRHEPQRGQVYRGSSCQREAQRVYTERRGQASPSGMDVIGFRVARTLAQE